MYFVLRTTVDEQQHPVSFEIVNYTNKTISTALALLDASARAYIREECGIKAAHEAKIIDIHNLAQTNEPIVDGMLIYRLGNDSHTLHIYQRKSKIVPGYIYGQSAASEFRRVQLFTLIENKNINLADSPGAAPYVPMEMVAIGPARIMIPKGLTTAPMCNVITQLKKSQMFKKCFETTNSNINSSPAPSPTNNKCPPQKPSAPDFTLDAPSTTYKLTPIPRQKPSTPDFTLDAPSTTYNPFPIPRIDACEMLGISETKSAETLGISEAISAETISTIESNTLDICTN